MIECRHVSPYVDGRIAAVDERAPTDFGTGRRCVECGAKVSRYSEPAPDGPRCSIHWKLGDDLALLPDRQGVLRVAKAPSIPLASGPAEAARVDREVEYACEAEMRLDAAVSLTAASRVLHVGVEGLRRRALEWGVETVGMQGSAKLYRLGAVVGVPGMRPERPAAAEAPAEVEELLAARTAPQRPAARAATARRWAARAEAAGVSLDALVTLQEAASILLVDHRGIQRRRARLDVQVRGRSAVDRRARLFRLGDLVGDELLGGELEAA